jgi:hypothetical protein
MKNNYLLILLTTFISFSSYCQKLYSTDYKSQADINVFVVDYKSQSDLKVFFVKYKSQAAGWRDNSKKHLLY